MSVIWSGITEGGAIVPVQVDETGKVIATAEVREEYWTQNGNQLIPVNASNDIATYGKIVLGRASSGTSTLQSPPDAAGEVFTFPKTGGTLAIEGSTPTPGGLQPFAYGSIEGNQLRNSIGVRSIAIPAFPICNLTFEADLVGSYPLVFFSFRTKTESASPNFMTWQLPSSGAMVFNFEQIDGSVVNAFPQMSFIIYDIPSNTPVTPLLQVEGLGETYGSVSIPAEM